MRASHQRSREAPAWARRSAGRARRSWRSPIVGLPVAVHIESATPHEVTLVHATLAQRFVKPFPVRLIGDNAYESDRLDANLARRGVELIAPHPASLPTEVEDRATLCLAPEFSAARCPLRALRRELSCDATPRLLPHSLARFMRWLLVSQVDRQPLHLISTTATLPECGREER